MCLTQREGLSKYGPDESVSLGPTGVGWDTRTQDMSLEVPRVDHGGQEVLELHRSLVAIEEIHAPCSGWVRALSKLL